MKQWRWVLLGGVLAMTGCTMVPVTEWNATQAQNRALAEQNKAQLVQIDNLQEHCRVVENRMLSDERQLAGLRERAAADRRELETCRREEQDEAVRR